MRNLSWMKRAAAAVIAAIALIVSITVPATVAAIPVAAAPVAAIPVAAAPVAAIPVAAIPVAAAPVAAAAAATTRFVPVTPSRLLDTRAGQKPGAKSTTGVQVTGRFGVPVGATAVVVNVTATQTGGAGFVTVFPTGTAVPTASNLNPVTSGQTVPNLVTVPVGTGGQVSLFTYEATHLIVDVFGYYVPASHATAGRYRPVGPTRVYDSRGKNSRVAPHGTARVPLGPSVPADAVAAVLNVTVADATGPGYWTVFAAGTGAPGTSNVNVDVLGQNVANQVIVPITAAGVDIFSWAGGHVIVDVAGYFTGVSAPDDAAGLFVPLAPTRLLDTRQGGEMNPLGAGKRPLPGWTVELPVIGRATIPAAAAAVVMNTTLADASRPGYVTVYPAGTIQPDTSTVNANYRGQTIANHTISPVTARGVSLFNFGGGHLIGDVTGFFTGESATATVSPPTNALPAASFPLQLEVPAIGLTTTVHEGIELEGLNDGPGHWPGSAMPGVEGNMAFFGHRTSHTHPFLELDKLVPGNDVLVRSNGYTYRYKVTETLITAPSDADTIGKWTTTSTVTLVACHPPGSIDHRIVVRAELVEIY